MSDKELFDRVSSGIKSLKIIESFFANSLAMAHGFGKMEQKMERIRSSIKNTPR